MRNIRQHGGLLPCFSFGDDGMSKVVLITGASSGIGKAAALRFIEHGHTVYAGARRLELMEDLAAAGVHTLRLDVTDEESCAACVDEIIRNEGGVDILINNAGYGAYGPVEAVPLTKAQAQLDVNLYGVVRMVKLIAPVMREQGHGRIVNISSAAGRVTTFLGGWYHAAKYALEAVSDSLRMELSGYGVDVVLIEPGGIRSAWGAITADHLSASSKGSVYEETADIVADVYRTMYREDNRMMTSVDTAARKIYQAASVRRPRTRYLFGFGARMLVFLHAVLPDRWFDRLMKRMYTSKAARKILLKKE